MSPVDNLVEERLNANSLFVSPLVAPLVEPLSGEGIKSFKKLQDAKRSEDETINNANLTNLFIL